MASCLLPGDIIQKTSWNLITCGLPMTANLSNDNAAIT